MACKECGNTSDGTIGGLCSSCTMKKNGCLFPWLEELEKKVIKEAAQQREKILAYELRIRTLGEEKSTSIIESEQ